VEFNKNNEHKSSGSFFDKVELAYSNKDINTIYTLFDEVLGVGAYG